MLLLAVTEPLLNDKETSKHVRVRPHGDAFSCLCKYFVSYRHFVQTDPAFGSMKPLFLAQSGHCYVT